MLLQALWLMPWPSVNTKWSYSLKTPNVGENQEFFVPRDLEIWQMSYPTIPNAVFQNIPAYFRNHIMYTGQGFN